MVQQPAKDGNNTINYTILLHMPRTYYGKNYLRINFFIKRSLKRSKNPFLVISLPGRILLHHIMMKNNSITSIE
jgi:hypothetical protein